MKEGLEGYMEKIADLKDVAAITKSENDTNSTDGKSTVEIGGKDEKADKNTVENEPERIRLNSSSEIPESLYKNGYIFNAGHKAILDEYRAGRGDSAERVRVLDHLPIPKIPGGLVMEIANNSNSRYEEHEVIAIDVLLQAVRESPRFAAICLSCIKQELGNTVASLPKQELTSREFGRDVVRYGTNPDEYIDVSGSSTKAAQRFREEHAAKAERERDFNLFQATHARELATAIGKTFEENGVYELDDNVYKQTLETLLQEQEKAISGFPRQMILKFTGVDKMAKESTLRGQLETLYGFIESVESYYNKKPL